ncbi:MAG: GH36-type glycosyl hydrolase domain-containing protein [Anaerolineae bacterium]
MQDSETETRPANTGRAVSDTSAHGELSQHAQRVAQAHRTAPDVPAQRSLLSRLPQHRQRLQQAYQRFREADQEVLTVSYAAEWLLDNFYLVEQALRLIREDIPESYYHELPRLSTSPLVGHPRVYDLAREIVLHLEGVLEISQVRRFVSAYQDVAPLTMGEIWALPLMLRLVSIENLSDALARVTELDVPVDTAPPPSPLLDMLAPDLVASNSIRSLRILATTDWEEFFESLSRVEQILRSDPAGIYARMDFATRNRYRQVVEELAKGSDRDEESVAQTTVHLAQRAIAPIDARTTRSGRPDRDAGHRARRQRADDWDAPRTGHVGYYLDDAGRPELEEQVGYRASGRARVHAWVRAHPTPVYLGSIGLLLLVFVLALVGYAVAAGGNLLQVVAVGLLVLMPTLSISVDLVNAAVTHLVPPRVLPQLDFRNGVPERFRTMVVIPGLLSSADDADSLLQQLELHYLSNTDRQLRFALLTDWGDAPAASMPEDESLVAKAREGIDRLNVRYGNMDGVDESGPFYLFHRERRWNTCERCYMAWERKRGKLIEFNRLLRGAQDTSFVVQVGDQRVLPSIVYVITLDADTILPRESARSLIATLAHPLNRAQFSSDGGTVTAGYTVLQPRVEVSPTSASQSLFARIQSGDTGLDLYTLAVSDVYQDLFGEGVYAGKGIYDVDAFQQSLAGRAPENALLSHDLFEGIHGRVGLVTNVVLIEDYPAQFLAFTRRLHRWIRGDWQLLPWLSPRTPRAEGGMAPNDLSRISRWKIVDNLRRSLLMPTLLLLWVAGWLWLPGSALAWTLVGLLVLFLPVLVALVEELTAILQGKPVMIGVGQAIGLYAERQALALASVPYHALVAAHAIGGTLLRLLVTRKSLLQWTSAAQTSRSLSRHSGSTLVWQEMAAAPVLAVGIGLLVGLLNPLALPVAIPFILLWLVSPQIAYQISQPFQSDQIPLSPTQLEQLRCLARRTWLFFEEYVGPDDNWLPPDHYQHEPRGVVAHRTSPTNVGLWLLACVGAYDLGYQGPMELALRLGYTLDTIDRLEKYRGHLLNWYTTHTLDPLPPRYVSTVDSGNLLASLLAMRQACLQIADAPILRWESWQGMRDALSILGQVLDELPVRGVSDEQIEPLRGQIAHIHSEIMARRDDPSAWAPLVVALSDRLLPDLQRSAVALVESSAGMLAAGDLHDFHTWMERTRQHLTHLQHELTLYVPWRFMLRRPPEWGTSVEAGSDIQEAWRNLVETLSQTSRYRDIPDTCTRAREQLAVLSEALDHAPEEPGVSIARSWCNTLREQLDLAEKGVQRLLADFERLAERAEVLFRATDLGFLYDSRREVFRIGYNVDAGRLDEHHYDLLASEARTAGLMAIAKDEVPQSHWLHLGRPFTRVEGERVLLSWSGTMFEYLMPDLYLRSYRGTLLHQSSAAAVAHQIGYGRKHRLPWGISESGYYRFDSQQNYQYRAFGVPGLGLDRGLGEHMVITPYASLLALCIRPQEVMDNIAHLTRLGMLARYGFYEAVDFTPSRLPIGQSHAIVQSFMAHHQAMILLSLTNCLKDRAIVERLHADPRVQSTELLLQEQVPRRAPVETGTSDGAVVIRPDEAQDTIDAWHVPAKPPLPQVQILSNGRYTLLVSSSGGGYSRWNTWDLTRWRSDTTLDDWGTWIYVQDRDTDQLWSISAQPLPDTSGDAQTTLAPHQVSFRNRFDDISAHCDVTVSLDDDVEIRRVTLSNLGDHTRRLSLASYAEVVLGPAGGDERHPAFGKLFVESEYLPEVNGLLFRRRPRSATERTAFLLHMLLVEDGQAQTRAHESDRARFLGRGGSMRAPAALLPEGEWLSATTGATLDPIMSLGQDVVVEPHASVRVAYLTLAGESRRAVLNTARTYQTWSSIDRTFDQARVRVQSDLRQQGFSDEQVRHAQQLLSALIYPHGTLRANPERLASNSQGQPALWPYAISGDHPVLLVRLKEPEEVGLVQELLQAHSYWRQRQVKVDLVILNERDTGYAQELHNQLQRVVARTGGESWLNARGGIFILRADQMPPADRVLLDTVARVVLDASRGSLSDQLAPLQQDPLRLPGLVLARTLETDEGMPPLARPSDLLFDNGFGGFTPDGREYVIYLEAEDWTPAPWINVVANEEFGFLASESGLGYTWAENSGENRLSSWSNDPVSDRSGEALYLRDEETGEVWTPTPLPAREPAPYLIRHGAGYTVFEHHSHGIRQELELFVPPDAPAKVLRLRLHNTTPRPRRITATYYVAWVLHTLREASQLYVIPEYDGERRALLARNPYNAEFGERVAFLAASQTPHGLTTDRTEFLGRLGDMARPAALYRVGLESRIQPGLDPCAAMQLHIDLAADSSEEVYFLLGQGRDREHTLRLIDQYQDPAAIQAAWDASQERWDALLGAVTVRTPDRGMDLLLNRWLLYQSLSCRIWGRSAFYQSSGAYGFRDQLQDVMGLVHAAPAVARQHILRAARHQFATGDVLHWWHPPSGRGVRTRISDDLLWLPYVTAYYVNATGDRAILDEKEPFLTGEPLGHEEEERYAQYEHAGEPQSVYEHCQRAIERGATAGPHGLPLIGGGDWNDGMNRVGIEGRGESIWLGWFLHSTLTQFATLAEQTGNEQEAADYRARAEELRTALEQHAWDGGWYRRAYYDDGTPLGSAKNRECQIDSIAQSWAVLSGAADPKRAAQAMDAVAERLVRAEDQLVLLFTPPFDTTKNDPGYIKGYLPGIRENGGQYTHAATWAVWAFAEMGREEYAERLFRMMNPIYHSDTRDAAQRYRVEPYVIAADVYGVPPHTGRGGWTWYTGSGSWFYRLGLEGILGLRRIGDVLQIDPRIPPQWQQYHIAYRHGQTRYEIEVENPDGASRGVRRVTLDGETLPDSGIPLLDDGRQHLVTVTMG